MARNWQFRKDPNVKEAAKLFTETKEVDKEKLIEAGEIILVKLYDGKKLQSLDNLRVHTFLRKSATSARHIQPQDLPPTSDSARFHILRAYLQVQEWMGETYISPTDFGWELVDNRLCPVRSVLPPAPSFILKMIYCTCKGGYKNNQCSCVKSGIDCTDVCKFCNLTCQNQPKPDVTLQDQHFATTRISMLMNVDMF